VKTEKGLTVEPFVLNRGCAESARRMRAPRGLKNEEPTSPGARFINIFSSVIHPTGGAVLLVDVWENSGRKIDWDVVDCSPVWSTSPPCTAHRVQRLERQNSQ
jgi:hypothetical protein